MSAMNLIKRKFNPWVLIVTLGVATLLFSFYAVQSQSDLVDARKEIERLVAEVMTWRKEAVSQREGDLRRLAECEAAKKQMEEDCNKTSNKK